MSNDELEEVDPDEIVVRVTDDRVIVFAADETKHSRWGRWLADLKASELRSALQTLDAAARAVIEAKRLTGALVELHPTDREMFKSGFKAIAEEGSWLQANFRDSGQITRLMRIRPAAGVAAVSGGALTLAAIAAQAQAAEMARDIKAIGQRVDQIFEHLRDEQIGAVENAVKQVEELVDRLRAHGADGVSEGEFPGLQLTLGDARRKCIRHLKSAVTSLERADQGSLREAKQILSRGAVDDVVLYLDLVGRLDAATVQLGLAQVAFDCYAGRPEVAKTRAEQIAGTLGDFRDDIEDVRDRLGTLDRTTRAQFLPVWKIAGREIVASAVTGAGVGGVGGAVVAGAPAVADAVMDSSDGADGEDSGEGADGEASKLGAAALFGAAMGLVVGAGLGVKPTFLEVRAKKPLDEGLRRLAEASSYSLETSGEMAPSLEWLHTVTREITGPEEP